MLIGRPPVCALLITATVLGGAIAVQAVETRASIQTAAKDRCKRYERYALSQNSRGVVVSIRSSLDRREGVPPTLSFCRRRDGAIFSLASPGNGDTAFPPPAISLVGGKIAYAVQSAPSNAPQDPGALDEYITIIVVRDIESGRERFVRRVGPDLLMKIGSLVLSARDSLAWIACPEPHREPEQARLGPTCDRTGARDYVYIVPAGELRPPGSPRPSRPRRVGASQRIDPNSLKQSGDTITWREGRGFKRARFR